MTDKLTSNKYLVDGGALLSIVPPTHEQRLIGPNETKLKAANGSDINCFGTVDITIQIGNQTFSFNFIIADVQTRILGADFLASNYLAPNHRDAELISLKDYSTLPAQHARGFQSIPINFVNHIDDPFYSLLDKYPEITTPSFTIKDPLHGVRHHIPTNDGPPIQSRARRLDPEKLAVAKAELQKLVDLGVCYRGKSEWASPLLVTTKPNGGWRVCGDYRRLNNMTTDDRYPVRSLQDFTVDLHGKKFFSKIDLMKGYHQIPVADSDVRKTAVITPFGLFVFPRCPFGLKNAGQDFQRLMDAILGDLPRVYVYIDDILVASETKEQHIADLENVFKVLSANGLVVQRSKCVLGVPSLDFLGYRVDSNGISPLPDRVVAIRATTPPTSVKELQRFLGMVGYYRRFMPNAATHLYHLFEALKGKPKTLVWTPDMQKSFNATKESLAKATLLFHPRSDATLALTTDASNLAVGGVLEQRGPDGWEPLAFYSSKLKPNEKIYPPYDRELLGAFKAVRHFRDMIEGRHFTLYTDHQSLVPSLSKKTDPQTARQTYQLSCISEFTTDIRYVKGKANLVADALSRPNETDANLSEVNIVAQTANPVEFEQSELQKDAQGSPLDDAKVGTAVSATVSGLTTSGRSEISADSSVARAASAAETSRKVEASLSDLNCVISAIGDYSIDWEEVARLQPLDPEFRQLRANARNGLNFKSIDIGRTSLIVDTSNGPYRPYIPQACRRRIFDVIHGLGHPGVERTRQAMCSKFIWPSIRSDSSQWARECLSCQQAKVTRNVTPPIGEFTVPNKRFEHINLDIVTLPESNGYKYLLTAVDRFSRWPIAIPMSDMTVESVIDAFSHGWVASFGVPSTITTDRGAQFSSAIFTQLTKLWGIRTIMTTPYHPEANGLVERFHRRLKESLIALGAEEPENWYWRLPMSLLAIRTTLKPDLGASPADLVFGEGLAVPGENLPSVPATDDQLARQRISALADCRVQVSRLQPVATSAHRKPLIHLPQDLETCSHVFVRRGGIQSTLSAPYLGPYRVISRNNVNFRIAIPGRANETVSISRVKPAVAEGDDLEEAAPASPPPPGRRPRAPQNPPTPRRASRTRSQGRPVSPVAPPPPLPPSPPPHRENNDDDFPPLRRRNRRRRRPDRIDSEDDAVESPPPPPSPVRLVANPPDADIVDTPTDWTPPPWFDSSGDAGDDADERPVSPPAASRSPDWFSPDPIPPPPVPSSPRVAPRQRLFSNPRKGHFSYRPPPRPPVVPQPPPRPPVVPQPPAPEVSQGPPIEPKRRFFSKGGRFSRRRPDVNALQSFIRGHLGISASPSTLSDSGASEDGFFPQLVRGEKTVRESGSNPSFPLNNSGSYPIANRFGYRDS